MDNFAQSSCVSPDRPMNTGSHLCSVRWILFWHHFEKLYIWNVYHQNWGRLFAFLEKSPKYTQFNLELSSSRLIYAWLDVQGSRKLAEVWEDTFLIWFNIYSCVLIPTIRPFLGTQNISSTRSWEVFFLYSVSWLHQSFSILFPDPGGICPCFSVHSKVATLCHTAEVLWALKQ